MQTSLYKGHVYHTRWRPKRHHLRYRVFSLLIDLDEFEDIASTSRMLGINRPASLSFWEKDHGAGTDAGLKHWVLEHLDRAGFETEDVSVRLLCYPRMFGYVFNPLSIYYCYDRHGALFALLHEVNNTFGEKHTYVLPVQATADEQTFRQSTQKNLPVSPFTHMDAAYEFKLNAPDDQLRLLIQLHDNDGTLLSASFSGKRHEVNDRALTLSLLQYPLMTLKVMASIHLEALKLWVKGVPLVPRSAATEPHSVSYPPRENTSSELQSTEPLRRHG